MTRKETIELTSEQKKKAQELAKKVQNGEIHTPRELFDDWQPAPPQIDVVEWVEDSEEKRFIRPSKIKGTPYQIIDRLDTYRLTRILGWLYDGAYHLKPESPPDYHEINGEYYVGGNGVHRTIAFKHLGIDQLWAKVSRYEYVNEEKRKLWE